MALLRTPESRFDDLPGYPWAPRYVEVGDALPAPWRGARMATVDAEGPTNGASTGETFLCLHGEPSWSYLYRKMIPTLQEVGRVVAPDLLGLGRSDKHPDDAVHTFGTHLAAVEALIQRLDLRDITLVCQDWGGLLGLPAAVRSPERFRRLVIMNTGLPDGTQQMPKVWREFHDFVKTTHDLPIGFLVNAGCETDLPDDVWAAYEAPFPTAEHKAAARTFPQLVPTSPSDEAAPVMRETRQALAKWQKPCHVLFSRGDAITRDAAPIFRKTIPTASEQPEEWIEGARHFLQEDKGEEVAERILAFVERAPG